MTNFPSVTKPNPVPAGVATYVYQNLNATDYNCADADCSTGWDNLLCRTSESNLACNPAKKSIDCSGVATNGCQFGGDCNAITEVICANGVGVYDVTGQKYLFSCKVDGNSKTCTKVTTTGPSSTSTTGPSSTSTTGPSSTSVASSGSTSGTGSTSSDTRSAIGASLLTSIAAYLL